MDSSYDTRVSRTFPLLLLASALAGGCGEDDAGSDGGEGSAESAQSGTDTDAGAGGAAAAEDGEHVVALPDGKVQGDAQDGAVRFLKIPFASPPVGELRWRPPAAVVPWDGVRHEDDFSSPCPQRATGQSPKSVDEDCLYLNVWQPEETAEAAPVMVWIHGGGNTTGSAADIVPLTADHLWYDGRVFAERHGLVVVTINYRLGAFGFFAHPALEDEEGSVRGNQGMLDQVAALKWVRDNIESFGGDPDNVTIFGQSAGSGAVCSHMTSPLSRGLFHRAISQSGGCTSRGAEDRAQTDEALIQFATDKGCDGADVLDCLREKAVDELIDLTPTSRAAGTGMSSAGPRFGTVQDGSFLEEPPGDVFARGDNAQVPYILGSNSDEGMLYVALAPVPESEEEYLAELEARYGDNAERVAAMYPSSRFDGNYREAMARLQGDPGLVCGTDETARAAAASGIPVYMYNYDIPWSISRDGFKATHAAEISHVFGTPYEETDDNLAVSDAMNAYWARFATTGDPNGDGAPADWPLFQPDDNNDGQRLQFDPDYEVLDTFRKEECTMWREIGIGGP